MKILIALLTSLMLFSGCSTKTVYVDRPVEVHIPGECKLIAPERAVKGDNRAESLLNILRHRDKLEVTMGAYK